MKNKKLLIAILMMSILLTLFIIPFSAYAEETSNTITLKAGTYRFNDILQPYMTINDDNLENMEDYEFLLPILPTLLTDEDGHTTVVNFISIPMFNYDINELDVSNLTMLWANDGQYDYCVYYDDVYLHNGIQTHTIDRDINVSTDIATWYIDNTNYNEVNLSLNVFGERKFIDEPNITELANSNVTFDVEFTFNGLNDDAYYVNGKADKLIFGSIGSGDDKYYYLDIHCTRFAYTDNVSGNVTTVYDYDYTIVSQNKYQITWYLHNLTIDVISCTDDTAKSWLHSNTVQADFDSGDTNYKTYGKVSLPNIDTVWTDKTTYTAMAIYQEKSTGDYFLLLGNTYKVDYIFNEELFENKDQCYLKVGDNYIRYKLINEEWIEQDSGNNSAVLRTAKTDLIWTSHPIYTDESRTSLFFHKASSLVNFLTVPIMTGALTQIVMILPIGLLCLIGYLGLRKGLKILAQTLSRA